MNTKQFPIFVVVSFILMSCTSSTQVDKNAEVNIQSTKSVFSTSEKVQFFLTNPTNEVLYLNYCGPTLIYRLEAKAQENWKNYTGGICLALYSSEFIPTLNPGETKLIELNILDSGTYRYNLAFTLSSRDTQIEEVSTEFFVQ